MRLTGDCREHFLPARLAFQQMPGEPMQTGMRSSYQFRVRVRHVRELSHDPKTPVSGHRNCGLWTLSIQALAELTTAGILGKCRHGQGQGELIFSL